MRAEVTRRLGEAFGAAYRNAGRFSAAWRGFRNRRLIEPESYEAAQVALQVAEFDAAKCLRAVVRPRDGSASLAGVSIFENRARATIQLFIQNRAPFQIGLVEEQFDVSIALENARGNGCEQSGGPQRTGVQWIAPGDELLRTVTVEPTPLRRQEKPEAGAAKVCISGRIVVAGPWENYEQTVRVFAFMWLPFSVAD